MDLTKVLIISLDNAFLHKYSISYLFEKISIKRIKSAC